MARQSFRGAGGGGAFVVPSRRAQVFDEPTIASAVPQCDLDPRPGLSPGIPLAVAAGVIGIVGILAVSGGLLP